jgi:uncharacterized delta-60 repeat protein
MLSRARCRSCSAAILLFAISFLFAASTQAQLDPSFGSGGVTATDVFGDDAAIGSFVLPSGKILVVSWSRLGTDSKYYFVRYNSNGSLDTTYGTNGRRELLIPFIQSVDRRISEAARQTDGKIVLAGFDGADGIVLRFNEDGSLDTTFSGDGVHRPNIAPDHRDGVNAIAILSDGKILISGFEGASSFFYNAFLLRYLPNGELDPAFGNGGFRIYDNIYGNTDNGSDLLIQSTGRIVVVNPTEYNVANPLTDGANVIATFRRFHANGDPDMLLGSVLSHNYRAAGIQPDDKILVGSVAGTPPPLSGPNMLDVLVTRFNANGGLDTAFGVGGASKFDITAYQNDSPSGFLITPDGQIIVSVTTYLAPNRTRFRYNTLTFARLSGSGSVQGRLLATGVFPATPQALNTLAPDGKIITAYATNSVGVDSDLLVTRSLGVPANAPRARGVPFDLSPNATGQAKAAVYRPSDQTWYIHPVFPGYTFALSSDIRNASDFLGDFGTELAVFRPSNGTWYIAPSFGSGSSFLITIRWGVAGDIPVANDYDGDGKSDIAVFRPSDGTWYIRNSVDESATIIRWGASGDKPVPGDYDGDGKIDIAVWRPSDGIWYVLKSADAQPMYVRFGLSGDIPVHEDYDGDGRTDVAVWRPSNGIWYRLDSSTGAFVAMQWGVSSDIAVPADYDGDLKTDVAVWRPSEGRWYIFQSGNGVPGIINWGVSTDVPIQARN